MKEATRVSLGRGRSALEDSIHKRPYVGVSQTRSWSR